MAIGSLVCAAAALFITMSLPAQTAWSVLTPGPAPAARDLHAMTFDTASNRTLLFGGRSIPNGSQYGDTWEWNGTGWLQRTPANAPSAREGHALAYDSVRGRAVLVAGIASNVVKNDTWEWNGTNWTEIPPSIYSPHLLYAEAAFDTAHARVVLFGGWFVPLGLSDLTFEWDGTVWTLKTPSTRPSPRAGHKLVYDEARGRIVLFGGYSATWLADTWEWDGNNWQQINVAKSPPARSYFGLAYDRARQRVVLYGGTNGGNLTDTWEYDGTQWVQRAPAGAIGAHTRLGMVWDSLRERTVVFGGDASTSVWEYGPVGPASFALLGNGCLGSAGVPTLSALGNSRPWTGDTFTTRVVNLPPARLAAVYVGFSNTSWGSLSLPLNLGFIGMTGCTLFTSGDVLLPILNNAGTGELALAVPSSPWFAGTRFYEQVFVSDPSANTFGATLSNAGAGIIGSR